MIQEFLQQKRGSWNIKILLLIEENQTSQVSELRAFRYMERCKNLGSLKPILSYTPSFSRARTCFSGPEILLGCIFWGGFRCCWLHGSHFLCLWIRQVTFFIHTAQPRVLQMLCLCLWTVAFLYHSFIHSASMLWSLSLLGASLSFRLWR